MDNAQKAIMIGVGLFITIIIISAVLLISSLGSDMINGAQGTLGNVSSVLQNQVVSAYDGKMISGAQVLNAWQQYENSDVSLLVRYTKADKTGNVTYVNATTGKYVLNWDKISTSSSTTGAVKSPSNKQSYPGGVYNTLTTYTVNTKKTAISALRTDNISSKTFYASIVRDASSDAVVGVLFVEK